MQKPDDTSAGGCQALQAELAALRRKLAFYEALVEDLPMPVFAKDEHSRFCLFNRAYEKFFGARREDMLGRTVLELDFLSPEERERYQAEDTAHVGEVDEKHYHVSYATPQGLRHTLYWTRGIVSSLGEIDRVGVIVDISKERQLRIKLAQKIRELRDARAELQQLCRTDALTGLANRRPLDDMLEKCVAMARRHGHPFSLLMFDLDFFKRINDSYGHEQGDKTLQACAAVLRENARREDLPARVGGEEFCILLPGTVLGNALGMAERIRLAVSRNIILPGGRAVTASLGVAQYQADESAEDLLRRADEALYRAKEGGRNRVCS